MKWWPFGSKKRAEQMITIAEVDDPLDPHGDGTLRPGDAVYDLIMQGILSGKTDGYIIGNRLSDGVWAMEEGVTS